MSAPPDWDAVMANVLDDPMIVRNPSRGGLVEPDERDDR